MNRWEKEKQYDYPLSTPRFSYHWYPGDQSFCGADGLFKSEKALESLESFLPDELFDI
jgi:hypothetical protein